MKGPHPGESGRRGVHQYKDICDSVWHSKYVTFQLAEVAVPRQLFAAILERIGRLAMQPAVCPSG